MLKIRNVPQRLIDVFIQYICSGGVPAAEDGG